MTERTAPSKVSSDWCLDLTTMPNEGHFEVLRVYREVFRHLPTKSYVIESRTGRMFIPIAWRSAASIDVDEDKS
jgi:hypothetical protein